MQTFSASSTVMFPSMGRGADTSAPPVKDAFREVFQNRLRARLASRDTTFKGTVNRPARPGNLHAAHSREKLGTESRAAAFSNSGESHRISVPRGRKAQEGKRHPDDKHESQALAATPAAGQAQATSQTGLSQNGPAAGPPQALRDFMAFLQSLPGGTLKIPPDRVPAVSSFLVSAGLPQAEVDQLLAPSGSQELTLSAADLQATWQKIQGQGAAVGLGAAGQNPLQGASNLPPAAASQSPAGSGQPQPTQDIRQTQDYRALWERLTLPQSLLPTLRLALANLGGSPEALAQLEDEGRGGQGIPLTRVWQILENVKNGQGLNDALNQGGAAPEASPSPAALAGRQPVTGAEMEEWRQLLLQAGLPSEVVEKLMGRESPGTQEQLQTKLLALAPTEEGPPVLNNPKPLYLPQNLRIRPFFWQSQAGGEQPQEQPQLSGNGAEGNGQSPASHLATLATAASPGETFGLPTFAAQLQGLTQGLPDPGAPLGEAGPVFRPLTPEVHESLWTQLQSGVTSNLSQGESQVTISLNPPELGQIQLSLQLSGQDLAVTAVASRPEVAAMANLGMTQLVQALAQQGLVLTQFQVRLQDQPTGQIAPVATASRGKGSEPENSSSTPSRRRSGEVDRFA